MFLTYQQYLLELKRPWKVASFIAGMAWLIYGAINYHIPDWDIGISLIMGGLTYLCAPWSVRVIATCIRHRPKNWILWILISLFIAWFVIDGVYVAYHNIMGNRMFRLDNFFTSSAMYYQAGFIWLYRGSLREFFKNTRSLNYK